MNKSNLDPSKFIPRFGDWGRFFEPIFETKILDNIYEKLKELGKDGKVICPDSENTYKTFVATPPDNCRVVFVLLDPYPTISKTGVKIANGIAMDCTNTGKLQPSLSKWYEAIEDSESDGMNLNQNQSPSLEWFYNQGIMFLNSALTVEYMKTGSHTTLWEPFMQYFFEEVLNKYFKGLIFVLCGKESQKLEKYIAPMQHYVFKLEHPSFAARQFRKWEYDNIFKKINTILKDNNNQVIDWVDNIPF